MPTLVALPAYWAGIPFADPACVLIAADAPRLLRRGAATALAADLPWTALAAARAGDAPADFLFTAAAGVPWRLQREGSPPHVFVRAEPMAACVAHAERLVHSELLVRLADGLEHELRNALNRLVLRTQLLERDPAAGAAAGALPTLRARIAALAQTQQRMIDAGCRMSELPLTVDPAALIEDLLPLCRASLARLPARLDVALASALPSVTLCPWRLQRLLLGGILASAEQAGAGAVLRLAAAADGRLRIDLGVRAASADLGAGDADALAAKLGALAWGLAQGRDSWEPRAAAGWRLELG